VVFLAASACGPGCGRVPCGGRNIDRNWELQAAFAGAKVNVPALLMVRQYDATLFFEGMRDLIANLKVFVPLLKDTVVLPDCGHWTQQEKAFEVNTAIIGFLSTLAV
jgi:pimeloyl-ACP methyl ester carboxylesterase